MILSFSFSFSLCYFSLFFTRGHGLGCETSTQSSIRRGVYIRDRVYCTGRILARYDIGIGEIFGEKLINHFYSNCIAKWIS